MSDLPLHRTMQDDEIDRLKAQLKEYEEKGRVLMDISRDLKARVTELEDALVWALGKLSIEVPVTGGNVSYIRAFEKADKALSSNGRAYLLRKQADAVEQCVKANKTVYLTDYAGRMIAHCNDYAQRLRNQADEAERAGGEK